MNEFCFADDLKSFRYSSSFYDYLEADLCCSDPVVLNSMFDVAKYLKN